MDSKLTFFRIASWKDFLSTAVTVMPFFLNARAKSSPAKNCVNASGQKELTLILTEA